MIDHIKPSGAWVLTDPYSTEHCFDPHLAKMLVLLCDGTVADLGCGNGDYVRYLKMYGFKCDGYDGNPHTDKITHGLCNTLDLSIPVDIKAYDCVVSLEVGEHIPAEFEDIFIDNVTKTCKNYLFLSWAVEGQAGTGHVNCRNNDYIIKKVEAKGFRFNEDLTQYVRERVYFGWFKSSFMVFVNDYK